MVQRVATVAFEEVLFELADEPGRGLQRQSGLFGEFTIKRRDERLFVVHASARQIPKSFSGLLFHQQDGTVATRDPIYRGAVDELGRLNQVHRARQVATQDAFQSRVNHSCERPGRPTILGAVGSWA